ncbi:hypothetical protein CHS0354_035662 [Potamilus streckersoni]|uniref:TBC1 domain family member 30 n=1 Tax=Potamilus streckersoni TaxID=2493646 RepID=A0AAE0VHR7_9BIVA|nr:hypothetical protein CHS0354_035662 [Potamilus streckersoni]
MDVLRTLPIGKGLLQDDITNLPDQVTCPVRNSAHIQTPPHIRFPHESVSHSRMSSSDSARIDLYPDDVAKSGYGENNSNDTPTHSDLSRLERHPSIVDGLLFEIYDRWHDCRRDSFDSDTFTECSSTSEVMHWRKSSCYQTEGEGRNEGRLHRALLESQSLSSLKNLASEIQRRVSQISARLVQQLKRRDRRLAKLQQSFDIVTAVLQASSLKRQIDTRMRFSIEPPLGKSAFDQWKDAMKAVARLPLGIPDEFRKTVWLSLADSHISELKIDWEKTVRFAFNDKSNPDDNKLGLQIVKDLHRTGCSGFSGQDNEEERALLKRVLLAYARWNKHVGYCQGFNVIAALILEVMNRKEDDALKVMIYLVDHVLPQSYFSNNLRALSVDMAVFRDLLRITNIKLSRHLDYLQHAQDQTTGGCYEPPLTNVFTMQWFLTLFATCLPKATVLRVWDSILLEGSEILLRTALVIWGKLARRIVTVSTADEFYTLMGDLTQEMLEGKKLDADSMIKNIYSLVPFPFPQLIELREKYTYNIRPFTSSTTTSSKKRSSSLAYSDEDEFDEEDMEAITCFTGILATPPTKGKVAGLDGDQRAGIVPDISALGPGAYGIGNEPSIISGVPAYMERMTTDISALKKQYQKLRQRQTQAHIILTAASARVKAVGPNIETPTAMNHLFVGKHDSKGRNRLVAEGPRIAPVFPTPTFASVNPQKVNVTQGLAVVETKKKWMMKIKGKTELKGSQCTSPVHSPTKEYAKQLGSNPNIDCVQKSTENIGKELNSELANSSKLCSDSISEKSPKEDNEPRMDSCPLQSSVKEQEFIPGPISACSPPGQGKNSPCREKPSTVPCSQFMNCNSDVPRNPSTTSQKYQDILCSPDNNPTKKVKLKDLAKFYSESQKLVDGKKNGVACNSEEKCTIISNTGLENSNGNISEQILGTAKSYDSSYQTSGTAKYDDSSYQISATAKYDKSSYQTSGSAKYDDSTNQTSGSAKYYDSSYQTSGSAKYYDPSYQTSGSAKYDDSDYQNIMIVSRASNCADAQVIEGNPEALSSGNIECNSCARDSSENAQTQILYSPLQDTDIYTAHTQDIEQQADKKEINIQGHPLNQESEKCPNVLPAQSIIKQVEPESKSLPWGIEESSSGTKNCSDTTIGSEMPVSESDMMTCTESIPECHKQISGNGDMEGEEQESSITWSSLSLVKARTMLRAADSLSKDIIITRLKGSSFSGMESEKEMEKILLTKTMSDSGKPEELQPVTKAYSGSTELTKSVVTPNSIDSDSGSEVFVSSDHIHQSKSFQQYYSNKRSMSATLSGALDNHQPKSCPSSKPFNPFPIKHVNQNRARTGVKLGLYKMSTLEEFEKNIRQPLWGK